MVNISASAILSEAWELAKKHFVMMSIFLFVIFIISYVIESIMGGPSYMEVQKALQGEDIQDIMSVYSQMGPSYLVSTLVSIALGVGVLNTALNIANGKQSKVDFSGFQMPFSKWVKLICASIIKSLLEGLAFCCCVIPGLIVTARLILVEASLLDDDELPLLESFGRSWNLTSGNTLSIIWLGILICIINIIGFCCCCVGLLFTMSLTYFAEVLVYLALKEKLTESYEG